MLYLLSLQAKPSTRVLVRFRIRPTIRHRCRRGIASTQRHLHVRFVFDALLQRPGSNQWLSARVSRKPDTRAGHQSTPAFARQLVNVLGDSSIHPVSPARPETTKVKSEDVTLPPHRPETKSSGVPKGCPLARGPRYSTFAAAACQVRVFSRLTGSSVERRSVSGAR